MAFQTKECEGSLWPNEKKTKPTHPNATGKAVIGGKLFYISAWTNTSGNGKKFMSLKFKEADEAAQVLPEGEEEEMPF